MKLSRAAPSPQLEALTDINLDDLMEAAGLARLRHTPLRGLFRHWARRFALLALEFDQRVGEQGLAQGSSWMLQQMSGGLDVAGVDHVPASGPVVILANHPGMTDTVALLASLASRPDLLVIALDRPFLRALHNTARHLIFVPDDEVGRMAVVRAGARHLRQGGALLSFPAGEIEPDPVAFGQRKAIESLQHWSASCALFARLVPQTRWVPALVSNVVSCGAQRHPLTLLRRSAQDRQRLASALQVALPRYRRMVARVAFGPAQRAGALDAATLGSNLTAQVRQMIEMSARQGHAAQPSAARSTARKLGALSLASVRGRGGPDG